MKEESPRLLSAAFKYSIPVLLGYLAIGFAFGLLMADAGYPWWLTVLMSAAMFAGAGQYIAVGLFAAGTSIWEAALVQLVVNARHIAYGLSMIKRMPSSGFYRAYCIFGMTDETFALLSSLPENTEENIHIPGLSHPIPASGRSRFMFLVTLLDHSYWISGSLIGTITGSLIPFNIEGVSFALTALFIVLMLEQIFRIRKPGVFIVSAVPAALAVLLPSRISLLAAITLALAASSVIYKKERA
ncbi:MAG: AzlC family ABC transporter permease [Treponema sp.]|jgi:4-azaleucine resistance transporter AzlC|nr:AzlC family ABC transporter permease [Treponema sp.]